MSHSVSEIRRAGETFAGRMAFGKYKLWVGEPTKAITGKTVW